VAGLLAAGLLAVGSSVASSRKVVHPSMKDAMPRTIRSPLKRSTLSRAPVESSQHCEFQVHQLIIPSSVLNHNNTSQRDKA